ncbi:hypothetical protein E9993_20215 [Labilibacter sediminis]|nr:hypothetical protein E9993_20215 [Labilibacter sediminis]
MRVKLLFAFLFVSGVLLAQNGQAPLSQGEKQLNMGLGFNGSGIPIYGGIDFAVHDDVTLGPQVNLLIDDESSFSVAFRGDYHFNRLLNIPSNWDVYAGANAGLGIGDDFPLELGIQIGGRWYWSDKWGLNLEFGGGKNFGTTLGVSMKF